MLSTIVDSVPPGNEDLCPTEEMEEEMCDEERFLDMYRKIESGEYEENERKEAVKGAEFHFSYDTVAGPSVKDESDSDSEDEPYVPPPGIKLPVGLTLPETLKQSHIIDRTAVFVVSKGPQMEVVIKAKQRNNPEQFGFLEFDNSLNPYYKYISKLIREKKYTPDFSKKTSTSNVDIKPVESKSSALAAIAAQHASESESDSDCELHPSLFAKRRSPSPDIVHRMKNAEGPMRKPSSPPPAQVTAIRKDYDVRKGSDMYSALFKSLAQIHKPSASQPTIEESQPRQDDVPVSAPAPAPIVNEEKVVPKLLQVSIEDILSHNPTQPDMEWQQWWFSFYGTPPPAIAPKPMLPPPPDMEPILSRYAELVARHGAELENSLKHRVDLQLEFMHSTSLHFSYYQHKVRYAQWELLKSGVQVAIAQTHSPTCSSPGLSSGDGESAMNRKQRRRLQNAVCIGPTPPPGVVDPLSLRVQPGVQDMHKTQSSPAILDPTNKTSLRPYIPSTSGPVSFSLSSQKEEMSVSQTSLVADEPFDELDTSPSYSGTDQLNQEMSIQGLISMPPKPPAIQSNMQLDRKEKARIFMEKLLSEKKAQKQKVVEDAKIEELERRKAELQKELEAENVKEDIGKKKEPVETGKTLDVIDHIINSRIENILQSSGLAPRKESEASKNRDLSDSDDERSRRKRSKREADRRSKSRERDRSRKDRKRKRSRDYDRRRR